MVNESTVFIFTSNVNIFSVSFFNNTSSISTTFRRTFPGRCTGPIVRPICHYAFARYSRSVCPPVRGLLGTFARGEAPRNNGPQFFSRLWDPARKAVSRAPRGKRKVRAPRRNKGAGAGNLYVIDHRREKETRREKRARAR